MIHIILIDAELELIPDEDRAPRILDQTFHRDHLEKMLDGTRRGRPDIIHDFISLCQSSIFNRKGRVRIWVHTRNDVVIEIDPAAKPPPDYPSFSTAMANILSGREEEGYHARKKKVQQLIYDLHPSEVFVMSLDGERIELGKLLKEKEKEDVAVVIGGFPEGDYLSPIYELATRRISLGPDLLTVWTVTCEVLSSIPK